MMAMTCHDAEELLDVYALGALDADDSWALERHLETCPDCPAHLDAARDTAASLALAVPLRSADASLKAKVMASAAALQGVPAAPRRQPRWSVWQSAVAAVSVLGVGLFAWGIYNQNELNQADDDMTELRVGATAESQKLATVNTQLTHANSAVTDLVRSQDAITDIVDQADASRLTLSGQGRALTATGRYVWSSALGMGTLVARDLPQLQQGTTYCLWFVYEGELVAGGTFTVDSGGTGRLVVRNLDVSPDAGALVGFEITVEPEGAISSKTGETVLAAALPR